MESYNQEIETDRSSKDGKSQSSKFKTTRSEKKSILQAQIKLKYLYHKLEVIKMDKMSLETFRQNEMALYEETLG
jgi:hypothetical protein